MSVLSRFQVTFTLLYVSGGHRAACCAPTNEDLWGARPLHHSEFNQAGRRTLYWYLEFKAKRMLGTLWKCAVEDLQRKARKLGLKQADQWSDYEKDTREAKNDQDREYPDPLPLTLLSKVAWTDNCCVKEHANGYKVDVGGPLLMGKQANATCDQTEGGDHFGRNVKPDSYGFILKFGYLFRYVGKGPLSDHSYADDHCK
jgi:hypothetical protein